MALALARTKGSAQRARPVSRNQRTSVSSVSDNKQPSKSHEKLGQGNSTGDKTQTITNGPPANGEPLPHEVSKENGSPMRDIPSENGSKVLNGVSSELPNQPTTPVVVETLAQTSQLSPAANAASVKWKSTLSAVDKDSTRMKSPNNHELIPLDLERNDSSLTGSAGAGESPRNLLSAAGSHAADNDRAKSSSDRKLSLGDFVTDIVQQTLESPVKWDPLESTNGLVNSLPYIPVSLAYTCLIMNVIVPGSGTILAAMSMMCCGEPRGQTKPDDLFSQFTTNIFVGISQFFTVTFFLAGWIWSISWGVYLVLFAEENRLMKAEEEKRNKTAAITNTLWNR